MNNKMERYLSQVSLWMLNMPRKAREGIIAELRSHIMESANTIGGPHMVETVISGMDPPRKTAETYRKIYGYGMPFKVFFVLLTIFISFWTVPIWEVAQICFSTTFVFIILILLLFFVGSRAGKKMALMVASAAIITRFVLLAIIAAVAGEFGVIQGGGAFVFLLSSLLLIPIAYLPARVTEKWEEKRAYDLPYAPPAEMRPCPRCQFSIPIQAKFCSRCGSRVW